MSTSQRTFEQVKSILGKLDRDIDAARQKRLQLRSPQQAQPAAAPAPASAPATPRPLATPGSSGFGRATPMQPRPQPLP